MRHGVDTRKILEILFDLKSHSSCPDPHLLPMHEQKCKKMMRGQKKPKVQTAGDSSRTWRPQQRNRRWTGPQRPLCHAARPPFTQHRYPQLIPSLQSIYGHIVRAHAARQYGCLRREREGEEGPAPSFLRKKKFDHSSTSVLVRIALKKFVDVFFHFNGAAHIPVAKQREKCSGNWADAV